MCLRCVLYNEHNGVVLHFIGKENCVCANTVQHVPCSVGCTVCTCVSVRLFCTVWGGGEKVRSLI